MDWMEAELGLARGENWSLGKTNCSLPAYFPSVSSVKTSLSPAQYVGILNRVDGVGHYLVSAYDVMRASTSLKETLIRELQSSKNSNILVLMDSGNYESYWKLPDRSWTPSEYHDALRIVKPLVAFGFDDQTPPEDEKRHLHKLNSQYSADCSHAGDTLIVPIVHGTADVLARICPIFSTDQRLDAIAIPERALGSGILERIRAIRKIREALNGTNRYILLHLLGTGNPISLALYSIAGADTFDGLEWCQTVVDHETALLHHLSHGDFFRLQTKWGGTDFPYITRTLAHNLTFYQDWVTRLASALSEKNEETFCRHNIPGRIIVQCESEFGWGNR